MIKTLIQNRASYITYTKVIKSIETYLDTNNFLKLDLPVLLPSLIPESYLEVFETEYRYMDTRQKLYLTPSPELLIKRLLVDGIGDCYYLGKSYRNSEPASSKHLGEFTMLELYKVGANYMDISEVVLELIQGIAKACHPEWNEGSKDGMLRQAQHDQYKITYQGTQINLSRWEKMTVAEAFQKYAGITAEELFNHEMFREAARRKGYTTEKSISKFQVQSSKSQIINTKFQASNSKSEHEVASSLTNRPNNQDIDPGIRRDDKQGEVEVQRRDPSLREDDSKGGYFTYEELWSQIYSNEIEPHLGKNGYPTLLYDYPVEFAALSKPNPDGKTAQRFEFYVAGIELGNCYSELTEWPLQEERLRKEQQERAKSGKISHPTDWGFIESLKKGLPECSGIAIGVDRLAMIFADVDSIEKLKLISL